MADNFLLKYDCDNDIATYRRDTETWSSHCSRLEQVNNNLLQLEQMICGYVNWSHGERLSSLHGSVTHVRWDCGCELYKRGGRIFDTSTLCKDHKNWPKYRFKNVF